MLTGYEAQDNLEVYIPPKRNGPPQASTSLRAHVHVQVLTAYIQEALACTVFRRYTSTCMYMHIYVYADIFISNVLIYVLWREREKERERARERE
jgi:hypothetical protein